MKKLLPLMAFVVVTTTCFSQNTGFNLAKVIKPGTKLYYDVVTAEGKTYDFIVTIKDKKGTSFKWEMTEPISLKGNITHSAKALANATAMYNFLQPGTQKPDDNTLCVWLSQKVFNHLTKNVGKPIKLFLDGSKKPGINMGAFTGSLDNEINVNGKDVTVSEELVNELVKQKNNWVVSDGEKYFTFYADKSFPIILRMDLGVFRISLREVK